MIALEVMLTETTDVSTAWTNPSYPTVENIVAQLIIETSNFHYIRTWKLY